MARAAPLQEDYLIAVVHALDEPMTAEALQTRVDLVVAGLIAAAACLASRSLCTGQF